MYLGALSSVSCISGLLVSYCEVWMFLLIPPCNLSAGELRSFSLEDLDMLLLNWSKLFEPSPACACLSGGYGELRSFSLEDLDVFLWSLSRRSLFEPSSACAGLSSGCSRLSGARLAFWPACLTLWPKLFEPSPACAGLSGGYGELWSFSLEDLDVLLWSLSCSTPAWADLSGWK